ncbi:MAG TPA: hypothetical protein VIW29_19690 [Polyangiaceae bacterium]
MLARARLLRPSRPACLALGGLLTALAGCSSDDTTVEDSVTHPTLIEVAPTDFLGSERCVTGSDDAGIKRYVATAYDVTDDGAGGAGSEPDVDAVASEEEAEPMRDDVGELPRNGFKLPSSGPTSCTASVGFGLVVPGRRYRIRVDGYTTTELTPRASGSRFMESEGSVVEPSFRADCPGRQPGATDPNQFGGPFLAIGEVIIDVTNCLPFQ